MNKIKSSIMLLLAAAMVSAPVAHAESNKKLQAKKVKPKAVTVQSKDKVEPASIPQAPAPSGPKQTYQLVTDVFDGFGGESQSEHYGLKVLSGGQPSAIGVSEGGSYVVEAGYVHASFVMRGDVTGDGLIDVADVLYLVNYLFLGTSAPCPMEAGDVTCDGIVDVADVLFIINYLFLGTSPPGC